MIVKFSVVLSKEGQSGDARARVIDYLTSRGCKQTGDGRATLSFTAEPEDFDAVFNSTATEAPDPMFRHEKTVGASAPYGEPAMTTPEELEAFVEHVSIAPPAHRFGGKL